MTIRKSVVSGTFYPADPVKLKILFAHFLHKEKSLINYSLAQKNIIGGVVPHAGYIYSGYEAVHFYEIVRSSGKFFDTVIILNPNHTGHGNGAINPDESKYWETPLGRVEVDTEFITALGFPVNSMAHRYEHSGEAQVPFLQDFVKKGFKIVPITINRQNIQTSRKVAETIYQVNKKLKRRILLLASSDFSHYVLPETGKRLDDIVIQSILKLDAGEIYQVVKNHRISVCGYGPIMSLVEYSKILSADSRVKVLRKGNSGDTTPSDTVVDYVSMLFYKN